MQSEVLGSKLSGYSHTFAELSSPGTIPCHLSWEFFFGFGCASWTSEEFSRFYPYVDLPLELKISSLASVVLTEHWKNL